MLCRRPAYLPCVRFWSMPELPEVETIARGLAKRVTGDRIESVWLGQKKEPLKSPATEIAAILEHARIVAIPRMGKHIVFDLERNSSQRNRAQLVVDLVLTGQLQVA